MAANNASRVMLTGLGFSQQAADDIYNDQGIYSMEEWKEMSARYSADPGELQMVVVRIQG